MENKYNLNKYYPTLVVATMSSGKSTLINALIGKNVLPSSNRACTSKELVILDNDKQPDFTMHIWDSDDCYKKLEYIDTKILNNYNKSHDIKKICMEGDIDGISNQQKSLMLIDTPGINNSLDESHAEVTKKVVATYKRGVIIYVLNAEQIGTSDDNTFMEFIADKIKGSKYRVIFVINKMDSIDPEDESIEDLVNNCMKYIQSNGIEKPIIVPISASSGLMLKKVLNNIELNKMEKIKLPSLINLYNSDQYKLCQYAYPKKYIKKVSRKNSLNVSSNNIVVDNVEYSENIIKTALENTGLMLLEDVLERVLLSARK